MNFGVKTSQNNKDVLTKLPFADLSFSTAYEMFKVFSQGISEVSSGGTLNLTHNLKYIPIFLVYGKSNVTTTGKMLCTAARALTGYRTFTTTSTVSIIDNEASGAREVFYHLLEDPISIY